MITYVLLEIRILLTAWNGLPFAMSMLTGTTMVLGYFPIGEESFLLLHRKGGKIIILIIK